MSWQHTRTHTVKLLLNKNRMIDK